MALAAHAEGVLQQGRHPLDLLLPAVLRQLVDQCHVAVPHAKDKIILPIRKQTLDDIHQRGVAVLRLTDEEHAPRHLRRHMELFCPHVDIAEHDVVGNNIFNEGAPVVLLLVIALRAVERHAGHGADGVAGLVISHGKHRVVKMGAPAAQRVKGTSVYRGHSPLGPVDVVHILRPLSADKPQIAAGDDGTLRIDHANNPVRGVLDLQDNILKNPSRHKLLLHRSYFTVHLCNMSSCFSLYCGSRHIARHFFFFQQKILRLFG